MGWTQQLSAAVLVATCAASSAQAQEGRVWIQIEARNTQSAAQERFAHWGSQFSNVSGFRLSSGWYGVALGPYSPAEAEATLAELRASGRIPADSFIPDNRILRGQVWPNVAAPTIAPKRPEALTITPTGTPAAPQAETLADARAHEAGLSLAQRMDLQSALGWAGVYSGSVDGALGRGSRAAIAAWQTAQGFEATGVLLPSHYATLVSDWQRENAAFGFTALRDEEAGIAAELPLALVEFDRYAPPYALYRPKAGSGVQLRLISLPGDENTLTALYGSLVSSGMVPQEGARDLTGNGFTLSGRSDQALVEARAELRAGLIRGWVLSTGSARPEQTARIVQRLEASFTPIAAQVLDPGLVPIDGGLAQKLQIGLAPVPVRPALSGFALDASGLIATAAAPLAGCPSPELAGGQKLSVVWTDAAAGLAVLRADQAPHGAAVAQLSSALPQVGAEVALAGYPLGAGLARPTVTYGRLSANTELSIRSLAGDVGGAVIGPDGLVIGMLLPSATGQSGERAPMLAAPQIVAALQAQGAALPTTRPVAGAMAPEDLNRIGVELALQVICK